MKSVMISIKPKWCELIANRKKTIEVRKTKPKNETPFKCYIYCTKPKYDHEDFIEMETADKCFYGGGKVIGEFVCNEVFAIGANASGHEYIERLSCLSHKELEDYQGRKICLWGWDISDLKIYDEPKELSEFNKPCDFDYDCFLCDRSVFEKKVITDSNGKIKRVDNKFVACDDVITRPPQSWCYVEDLEDK